jgi:hypothetical protein
MMIRCPALFLGGSADSGRGLGLDDEAKLALFSLFPERFSAGLFLAFQIRDQG